GRFRAFGFSLQQQLVKATAMDVIQLAVVFHPQVRLEPTLNPAIKIYQVRIAIIEQGVARHEAKGDGESAAERFDEAALRMALPYSREQRNEPALASGPFQWGRSRKFERQGKSCLGHEQIVRAAPCRGKSFV